MKPSAKTKSSALPISPSQLTKNTHTVVEYGVKAQRTATISKTDPQSPRTTSKK